MAQGQGIGLAVDHGQPTQHDLLGDEAKQQGHRQLGVDAQGPEHRHQGPANPARERLGRCGLHSEGQVVEQPHGHHPKNDEAPRPKPEMPHLQPGPAEHLAQGGEAVGGELQHQGLIAREASLKQQGRDDGRRKAHHIEAEDHQAPHPGSKKDGGHEQENVQTRGAQRKGNDQHREQPQPPIPHHPGAHDRRHIAAKAHQREHEGAAIQPQPLHEGIHQVGRPREVAAVFHHAHGQEEQKDHRQKGTHRANALIDPLEQKPLYKGGESTDQRGDHPLAKPVEQGAQGFLQRHANGIDGLKHQGHHQEKQRQAQQRMQQHPIEPPGEAIPPLGRQGHRTLHELGDLALEGVIALGQAGIEMGHGSLRAVRALLGQPLRRSLGDRLGHLMAGLPQAAAVFGAEQDDGHGQLPSQGGGVDADVKTLGLIGHVEQQHRR